MKNREHFQQIVSMSRDCIKETDLDGRVLSVNANGLTALQAPGAGAIIGKLWWDLWPAESKVMVSRAVREASAGNAVQFSGACPTLAGEMRWWDVSLAPLSGEDGTITSLLAISRDVTDRVRAQDVATTLQNALADIERVRSIERTTAMIAQASNDANAATMRSDLDNATVARLLAERVSRQAQKGEAVGQVVAGIVHDLRNMLQIVTTATSGLMLREAKLNEKQQGLAKYAHDAAWHAATLVKRLLAFSRIHAYVPSVGNLHQVVESIVPLIRHGLGSSMALVVHAPSGSAEALVDEHSLQQALFNLCINSRDACLGKTPGSIVISFSEIEIAPEVQPSLRQPGHYRTIDVRDDCGGMDAETLSRAFEPFFTTKGPTQGSGLGLAQVDGMMRQAGGFVEADSTLGVGTTIRLAFPVPPS